MKTNIPTPGTYKKYAGALKDRIDLLIDNGARKINGDFHFSIDEVPSATITAEMDLLPRQKPTSEDYQKLLRTCRIFEIALNNALGVDHAYTDAFQEAEKEFEKLEQIRTGGTENGKGNQE